MIVEMGLTEFVPMICQWKLQSEDDIYDSITDWDYHEYRCIMKDGKEAIANGIADEGFDGHCCTYIDFYEDKYNVELRFPLNQLDFIQYNIVVEGAGIIPSLKDNKQMFVQSFAFDTKKKRWVKPTAVEGTEGEYHILVSDEKVISLLTEIRDILKSKS